MLINVKMPILVGIVGILKFMSRINFVLSLSVEYEKSFITLGPDLVLVQPRKSGKHPNMTKKLLTGL